MVKLPLGSAARTGYKQWSQLNMQPYWESSDSGFSFTTAQKLRAFLVQRSDRFGRPVRSRGRALLARLRDHRIGLGLGDSRLLRGGAAALARCRGRRHRRPSSRPTSSASSLAPTLVFWRCSPRSPASWPRWLGPAGSRAGVGAVASLIVLGALEERWSRTKLLWFSAKATPFLLILFCLSGSLWLSVLLLGLFGGMQIIFRTVSRLVIQVEAPRELLGRVMSMFLMDQGMRSLGSVVMGAFVSLLGAALGLALTSAASIVLTGITFWRLLGWGKNAEKDRRIVSAS